MGSRPSRCRSRPCSVASPVLLCGRGSPASVGASSRRGLKGHVGAATACSFGRAWMTGSSRSPCSAISCGCSPGEASGPRYSTADRALLAAASRFLPRDRWSAFGVVPDTLRRWRRQLEAGRGRRPRQGRGVLRSIRPFAGLILRMGRENPRWGYLRIKGELLQLAIITVSATTNVLRRGGLGPAPRRIGPTWREFLRAQALALLPTGSCVFDLEDRARRESGPAPPVVDAAGRLPPDEGHRPTPRAGPDPAGDQREPAREELLDPRLVSLSGSRLRVAHHPAAGGLVTRLPALPIFVLSPDHGSATGVASAFRARMGSRRRFAHGRPAGSVPASERRRSSLVASGSIARRGSTLERPPDRILVPNRPVCAAPTSLRHARTK